VYSQLKANNLRKAKNITHHLKAE